MNILEIIKIEATGSYHDLGAFISGMASLPRIVTLHDFKIVPIKEEAGSRGMLDMSITAKTYRYAGGDDDGGGHIAGRRGGGGGGDGGEQQHGSARSQAADESRGHGIFLREWMSV